MKSLLAKSKINTLIVLLTIFFNTELIAQTTMPIPGQASTFTGWARGYWFVVPEDITITGLKVPDDFSTDPQSIELVRFNSGPPPSWSTTTNDFTSLFRVVNDSSTGVLPVNIELNSGDYVGILGVRGDVNSYATAPFQSQIGSHAVTLTRLGMQFSLSDNIAQNLWQDYGFISRVEITYVLGKAYSVGGTVTGLNGSVTLQNNGADDITLNADGGFTFPVVQADATAYDITVSSQPATQTCTVSNGTGTIAGANVTNVDVVCTANTYTVGGNVTGLNGSITLQNNGGDDITLNADGVFTFPAQNDGTAYAVTISSQPATQSCSVSNGSGTLAGADVSNVSVTCLTDTYTVGGNVSSLSGSVTLQNNGGDDITLNADGVFTFPAQNDGTAYAVTVSSQPATQSCSVTNGSGTLAGADVSNVSVTCLTDTYTVGGNVSGLSGSVTLQNNGGDDITLNADGVFTFPAQNDGTAYAVTVSSQPATQTCSVSNGSGTLAGADVSNVSVTCLTDTYTVGGNVSGLSGSVTLQNNGGDDITLNADGVFTFPAQNDGTAYAVTVSSQPATQTCTVTNGSGTLAGADISNVSVTCLTDTYTVGGNVSGLSGSVTLQNNGGDDITLNADGVFTFPAQNDGTAYAVTVSSQPATQTCTVTNGSGSINGADVNNVMVDCVSDTPTVVLNTTTLTYSSVEVGQSQQAVINVTNTGVGDLVISGFNLPGSPFNVIGGSCMNVPVTLMSNESCEIEISFNPTTEGMFNDEIAVLSNAVSSPDVIQLVGNGVTGSAATPVPNFKFWGLALLVLLFGTTAYRFRKII